VGQTQILNVRQIRSINHHLVDSDENSSPVGVLDLEYWLNCDRDLDNPNDREDDCVAEVGSHIEQDNGIEDPECPE